MKLEQYFYYYVCRWKLVLGMVFFMSIFLLPHTAVAEAGEAVTATQQIRTGTCYDAVNSTIQTNDYIAVWDCEIQR